MSEAMKGRWLWQLALRILGNLLDRGTASAHIRECRAIHILWIHYLDAHPDFDSTQVGDQEHHRKWVRKYDCVLRCLGA